MNKKGIERVANAPNTCRGVSVGIGWLPGRVVHSHHHFFMHCGLQCPLGKGHPPSSLGHHPRRLLHSTLSTTNAYDSLNMYSIPWLDVFPHNQNVYTRVYLSRNLDSIAGEHTFDVENALCSSAAFPRGISTASQHFGNHRNTLSTNRLNAASPRSYSVVCPP